MKRAILHCDMNNYYATVETMLNPELKGKPLAVCGNTQERHGICLAKSYEAKKSGVRTGDPIFEIRRKCPEIIIVPPHFEEYVKYSKLAREIYGRFTDRVEPFGIDECWLDITGTEGLFGSPAETAWTIKETVKEELGLTLSVGVSFTKILAKLASDLGERDSLFLLEVENFKDILSPLPVSTLLGVGPATKRKLERYGIHTLGQLGDSDPDFLKRLLGINGLRLWLYARGEDQAPVRRDLEEAPVKTIGHGSTLVEDVSTLEEVHHVLLELSLDVAYRLSKMGLMALGLEVTIRDETLAFHQFQTTLSQGTSSPSQLADGALALFKEKYGWRHKVRAVTLRALSLHPYSEATQLDLLGEYLLQEKKEQLAATIVAMRKRYGRGSLTFAALLQDLKIPKGRSLEMTMPGPMKR